MSYIVPIGPYHPALEEPVHVKLYVEGESIKDADVFIGYNHRGIEKLATEKNHIQVTTLVERVCGICSHSHALAYCLALEKIGGMEVPKRGQYVRIMICELERLHSHFLWLGLVGHLIGFDSAFMYTFNTREKVMDMLEMLTGNRVNYAINIVGGARRAFSKEQLDELKKMLDYIEEPLKKIKYIYTNDRTVALRTKKVGILRKEDAFSFGVAGPHGRASGVNDDVRKVEPYLAYGDFDFNGICVEEGDVFARAVVRVLEIEESIKILRQALANMPDTPINLGYKLVKIPKGEACVRIEAPRGELTYYVVSNGTLNPHRVNIHVPTFRTAATVPTMLRNNSVADAGLIVASIDPCFSCLDR